MSLAAIAGTALVASFVVGAAVGYATSEAFARGVRHEFLDPPPAAAPPMPAPTVAPVNATSAPCVPWTQNPEHPTSAPSNPCR